MKLLAVLFLLSGAFAQKFYFKGTFEVPYANLVQPIEVNVDGNNYAWSFFNGMQVEYVTSTDDKQEGTGYLYHIRRDAMVCSKLAEATVPDFVPDYKGASWTNVGRTIVRGIPVEKYTMVRVDLQKRNAYEFYVTTGGIPVRLVQLGHNDVLSSHYDMYIVNYEVFRWEYNTPDAFTLPEPCKKPQESDVMEARASMLIRSMLRPAKSAITPEFTQWMTDNGKVYGSDAEAILRQAIYDSNMKTINAHNANPERTYTMVANQFADMTPEEITKLLASRPVSTFKNADHSKILEGEPLPSVDWRIALAPPVKNQCSCGSCWTFATIATIEGRYNIKRMEQDDAVPFTRLSEQNIVNCFWTDNGDDTYSGLSNHGCHGGQVEDALEALIDKKTYKMAAEYDEPYMGIDAWCHPELGKDEYTPKNWYTVPVHDNKQLKLAVAQGPVAVALRVPLSFAFYGHGVYKDEKCEGDLVHAVTVDGYTTDPKTGKEVWIVRNSWSSHWGSNGYIYIEIEDKDCSGLTESAAYVEF